MAQSVNHPTLDFGSGHDLMVHEIEPHIGICAVGGEPAWDSLFPSLSLSLPNLHTHMHMPSLSLSLKINKLKKKKRLRKD